MSVNGSAGRFQSTLSLRRATTYGGFFLHDAPISIHALLAESDARCLPRNTVLSYFNPRSPCGERRPTRRQPLRTRYFNPRSPCGERRLASLRTNCWIANFNPRSPCGERPALVEPGCGVGNISIHALLAESDGMPGQAPASPAGFQSTLSLRRATVKLRPIPSSAQFQSTLSLRRATP